MIEKSSRAANKENKQTDAQRLCALLKLNDISCCRNFRSSGSVLGVISSLCVQRARSSAQQTINISDVSDTTLPGNAFHVRKEKER